MFMHFSTETVNVIHTNAFNFHQNSGNLLQRLEPKSKNE